MSNKNVFNLISFSRMWKHEFRDFVFQLTNVVEKYDSEALKIVFVFDELQKASQNLDLLDIDYRTHPLSVQINELAQNRKVLIQSILMQVKTWNRASRVLDVPEAKVLTPFVAKYLRPLLYKNATVIADYLRAMYAELDGSDALQAAIVALRLNEMFEELRQMQISHTDLKTERRESRKHAKVKTEAAKALAKVAVQNLIKKVELNQLEFSDLYYSGLIYETNELSAYFAAQAKSRATFRKKSKSKESSANESSSTDVSANTTTAATAKGDSETVTQK